MFICLNGLLMIMSSFLVSLNVVLHFIVHYSVTIDVHFMT